jgi:hypothetical protein
MLIQEIIESRIESNEPQDTILAYLKENDGKKLTVRDAKKLSELTGQEIHIDKRFDMTHIEWGTYQQRRVTGGSSLLVAYSEKNVVIDANWIEEKNPAYFSAKDERNEKRQEMLAQPEKMAELQIKIGEYKAAKEAMEDLLDEFPDIYKIQEEFGI